MSDKDKPRDVLDLAAGIAAEMGITVTPETSQPALEPTALNSTVLPEWVRLRAAAEGLTLPPNITYGAARERVGEAIVSAKGYMAGMVLCAQGVHVRIIGIRYGGFILIGGVEKIDDTWQPTEGGMSTLYVTDFDNVTVVGQIGDA